ncbi:3'-phosphoesterase, partial [Candidatus Woesearchaeota archaeon]|nr:3'-phosphoesterase [Candidatus Woesearchaeota archaeon]
IPEGQYGAGTVKIWDKGTYQLKDRTKDKIEFVMKGKKMKGSYALIRFKKAGEKNWLLIKAKT